MRRLSRREKSKCQSVSGSAIDEKTLWTDPRIMTGKEETFIFSGKVHRPEAERDLYLRELKIVIAANKKQTFKRFFHPNGPRSA